MEFIKEINEAIELGVDRFKKKMLQKQEEDKNYLEQPCWAPDGSQMTVLNYLIQLHQDKKTAATAPVKDLTEHIDFVIENMRAHNIGEPIHQAIAAGKLRLAIHLLMRNKELHLFDINRRDKKGLTLLALALNTRSEHLLQAVAANNPDIKETSLHTNMGIPYQPLHLAIELNFAFAVGLLAKSGAQLNNPVGPEEDTPLILAARLGKIRALTMLLECPVAELKLEAENKHIPEGEKQGDNAIESLCRLLADDPSNKSLLKGVAMLLCRGAEPPRRKEMVLLLANQRTAVLQAIDAYLETRPHLVDSFVERCHVQGNSLHNIVYVDHSWGNALRQLFGRPSAAAFVVERLVTRKYSNLSKEHPDQAELPTKAASTFTGHESALMLYAEFVKRYEETYGSQRITNPWSTMRWKIAEGQCNWEMVMQYSKSHPASRTRIIVNDMLKSVPRVVMHDELEPLVTESTLVVS